MSIVGASGVHRRQLAYEYPDTVTRELKRSQLTGSGCRPERKRDQPARDRRQVNPARPLSSVIPAERAFDLVLVAVPCDPGRARGIRFGARVRLERMKRSGGFGRRTARALSA